MEVNIKRGQKRDLSYWHTFLQARGRSLRELAVGTAPPLDVPPTRRIYGGPAAAAVAADADKEFSSAATAVAINIRIAKGCETARLLADVKSPSELGVAEATRDNFHCDGTDATGQLWVHQSFQVTHAAHLKNPGIADGT